MAEGGTQPLYDWYGVLRSDGAGRMAGFIPDGMLCSGGNAKYAAYDAARDDWPATTVQPGAQVDMTYGAWVQHPGSFRLYVTKDSYDPTQPLGWDDLEDQPFLTADPEPAVVDGAYHLTGSLPANKTGRHIIYSVWTRSDSQETFYGCSDVIFSGSPVTPPPTTPPTTRPPTTPPPTTPPPTECTTTVQVDSSWPGGFQATVTVKNTGTAPMADWYGSWTMPTGTAVAQGWSGTFMTSGTTAMVHAPSWATTLAPGATATAGFLASNTAATAPTAFTDLACG